MIGENGAIGSASQLGDLIAGHALRLGDLERANSAGTSPPGSVVMTIAATAPGGWAFLAGQTLTGAQTAYPKLWKVAPAGWKSGANLILPNMMDRFPVMAGASFAVGTAGGANSRTITNGNLPGHTHSGNTGTVSADHTHGFSGTTSGISQSHYHGEASAQAFITTAPGSGTDLAFAAAGTQLPIGTPATTGWASHDHSHTYSGNTGGISTNHYHGFTTDGGTGGGAALDTTPAYLALNFMIRLP